MEQRNGRIDRKLQPSAEVFCHYFVYTDRKEDRILAVLVKKTELIKKELGSLSQVLEGRLARTLNHGIRHRDIAALERELDGVNPDGDNQQVVDEELEQSRERREDLKAQIQRLQNRLKASQDWLALREDHFRSAISCALQIMHADPLKPLRAGTTGILPSIVFSSRHSTCARGLTRPGPKRWTRSARPANAIRSLGTGAASRRSVPLFSTTQGPWTRTWFTFTWNTVSSSVCSGGSPPKGLCTTTSAAPASRRATMPSLELF